MEWEDDSLCFLKCVIRSTITDTLLWFYFTSALDDAFKSLLFANYLTNFIFADAFIPSEFICPKTEKQYKQSSFNAFIQSASQGWLTFTRSCTHSPVHAHIHPPAAESPPRATAGWSGAVRVGGLSGTPPHSARRSRDPTSNLLMPPVLLLLFIYFYFMLTLL